MAAALAKTLLLVLMVLNARRDIRPAVAGPTHGREGIDDFRLEHAARVGASQLAVGGGAAWVEQEVIEGVLHIEASLDH